MKIKPLESDLQKLDTLMSRNIAPDLWNLEQYATPPRIAAQMLCQDIENNDIVDKNIVDLGCGCGVLSIGCALMGAKSVLAIDIDEHSLRILSDNVNECDLEEVVSTMKADISTLNVSTMINTFDTAIMNPPFGTKKIQGIDRVFVEKALELAPIVYSLHKTSTRGYWQTKVATELNCTVVLPRMTPIPYNIGRQWKQHSKDTKEIEVDLLKFIKKKQCI